jgi:hypothetical protein
MAGDGLRCSRTRAATVGFYSRYTREVSLLHSKATDALRRGYGEPQRAGATGGSTVSLRVRGLTRRDAAWRFVRCWRMPCSCADSKAGLWYCGAQRRHVASRARDVAQSTLSARSERGAPICLHKTQKVSCKLHNRRYESCR